MRNWFGKKMKNGIIVNKKRVTTAVCFNGYFRIFLRKIRYWMECFIIFVMAWCWFNATESKPHNVKCNIFSELTLNASLLFFRYIISKNVAEKFCVISKIWTELCRKTLCWKYVAWNQSLRDKPSLHDNGKPKTNFADKGCFIYQVLKI